MTCSHLNLIAQVWLHKIDPKLSDLVKKEYGVKLQTGKMLAQLVPEISKNIDNLLKHLDSKANRVTFDSNGTAGAIMDVLNETKEELAELSLGEIEAEEREQEAMNKIRKIFRKGGNRDSSQS